MTDAAEVDGCMACEGEGFTDEILEIDGEVGEHRIACSCDAGERWLREHERPRRMTVNFNYGACPKCWGDAFMRAMSDTSKTQTEHYADLLEERKVHPCLDQRHTLDFGS